jgi:antitoxin PrlF
MSEMAISTVSTKGQCVVPKPIREYLDLHPGDKVDFVINEDGEVLLRLVVSDVRDLEGMLHKPGRKAVSLQEMDQAIQQGAAGTS